MLLKNKVFFYIPLLFFIPSSIYIGQYKIGPLISGSILLYYLIYILKTKNKQIKVSLFSTIYALKNIVNMSTLTYLNTLLYISIQYSFLGIILQAFTNKKSLVSLQFILKSFYIFLSLNVIINLFVFLGLIPQFGQGYDLSRFGLSNQNGFTGVYDNYTASIIFAFNAVCLYQYLFEQKFSKTITTLLIFCSILFTYKTCFRTGYACLAIGSIAFILLTKSISRYTKVKILIVFSIIFLSSVIYLYNKDKVFQYRISDENIYNENETNTNKSIGSGRFDFFLAGIDILKESNTLEILLGYGLPITTKKMEEKVGMKIFMHNELMNSLIQNGLIGLLIFVCLNIFFLKKIFKMKRSKYYSFTMSCYIMFIIYFLFQGGPFPIIYMFISYTLLIQTKDFLSI